MARLWKALNDFQIDYCEYLPENIPELDNVPSPNEFLVEHVLTNMPFVLKCPEYDRFPAVELWKDKEYLRKLMKKRMVTVAVTPDGRADSIVTNPIDEIERFMIPEERTMSFDDFFTKVHRPEIHQVYYLQKQNNNLIEEFSPLVRDVSSHVHWATEAFGTLPDAANIWIGDHQSVTSLHRDHYENIYYVITGVKTFILYPPVSIGWMPYKKCKKFQWHFQDGDPSERKWDMKDMNEEVEWIVPSHKPNTLEQFKMYFNAKSYVVEVKPGEALYLPALWFHEVSQTDSCIAVNYWYDMKYDMKYPFLKLFGQLCNLPISHKNASTDKQTELELDLLKDLQAKQEAKLQEHQQGKK